MSLGLLIFLADFGSVHLFKNVFERLRPCHQPDRRGRSGRASRLGGARTAGECARRGRETHPSDTRRRRQDASAHRG